MREEQKAAIERTKRVIARRREQLNERRDELLDMVKKMGERMIDDADRKKREGHGYTFYPMNLATQAVELDRQFERTMREQETFEQMVNLFEQSGLLDDGISTGIEYDNRSIYDAR